MSDLASLRAILKSELHVVSPYVDAAIYTALNKLRSEPLDFNVAKYDLSLSTDRSSYPLPKDFVGLRGRVYCTPSGQSDSARYEISPRSPDELEKYKYGIDDYRGGETIGQPKWYAIDHNGREFLVAPIPSEQGDKIYFKYTKDLGTPKLSASVTASTPPNSATATMTLLSPDGGTLESTFTNAWFKEGFDAVRSLALYNLYARWHSGGENASQRAQIYLLQHVDELQRLRGESALKQSVRSIRKYL